MAKVNRELPAMLPGEEDAVAAVQALGKQYGYGNLISRLREAWSSELQVGQGLDQRAADYGAGIVCPWCNVDCRTGRKYKKRRIER